MAERITSPDFALEVAPKSIWFLGDEGFHSETESDLQDVARETAKMVARRAAVGRKYNGFHLSPTDELSVDLSAQLITAILLTSWTKTAEHFLQLLHLVGWPEADLQNLLTYAANDRGGLFVGAAAGDAERCLREARAALERALP